MGAKTFKNTPIPHPEQPALAPVTVGFSSGISPDAAQGSPATQMDDAFNVVPMPVRGGGCFSRPGSEVHLSTGFAFTSPAGQVAIGYMPCPNRSDGTKAFMAIDTATNAILGLRVLKPAAFGAGTGDVPAFALDSQAKDVALGATATFHVERQGYSGVACQVTAQTEDGTAVAGVDYTAINTTLSFAAGETDKAITINTIDAGQAGEKTFYVRLVNPTTGCLLEFPFRASINMFGSY